MMMKLAALFMSLLFLAGCAAQVAQQTPPAVQTEAVSPTAEPADAADAQTPVPAAEPDAQAAELLGADFDLSLFRKVLAKGKPNTVISPMSAYFCFALALNGAGGDTLKEMETAMGGGVSAVNAYCKAREAALLNTAGSTQLSIANSVWTDEKMVRLADAYKHAVQDELGAELFAADLPTAEAMKAINAWVNEKTNAMIPTLLSAPLREGSAAVLLNTVYCKAVWEEPFDTLLTHERTFTKADGSDVTADFMDGSGHQAYIKTADAEGVVLPYDDGKTVFLALRPTDGRSAADFASALTPDALSDYIAKAKDTDIDFYMPKYTVTFATSLVVPMQEMGMVSMFDQRADFTKMGDAIGGPLFVSDVKQKVKVIVDEAGTEAAAVTGMVMEAMAFMPEEKPLLELNTPFLYALIDSASGQPLFIGVLDDPAAGE